MTPAVMAIAPETGRTLLRHDLPSEYFGEGIVAWGPNVYEWDEVACLFRLGRFTAARKQFTYMGRGGHDSYGERVITSDGTATLRRDPNTSKPVTSL
jgi:glutamine cyclotransferase